MDLSVSKVDCYKNCPRLYYYRYIKKPIFVENKHWVVGNITHKILELYHQQYVYNHDVYKSLQFSLQNGLSTDYTRKFLDNKTIKKSDIKTIAAMIKDYITNYGKNKNVTECEKSFKISLTSDIHVIGKIDRVDKEENIIRVVDYKTSKNLGTLKEYLANSVQLQTYGIWAKETYPEYEIICQYVFLKHTPRGILDFWITEDMLEECRDVYIEVANKIDANQFQQNKSYTWCRTCEYSEICKEEKNV
jgi:RecB family exonuclease